MNGKQCAEKVVETYKARTPLCAEHQARAARYLPGGDTRNRAYYHPYPLTIDTAKGCRIKDLDGNEYIDLLNNFSSLIHGHAYDPIIEAVTAQMNKAASHGCFDVAQYRLAKEICDRCTAVEQIRFCNSGTEATMFAMRSARIFTGKDGFIRIDGGYNGSHDFVGVNETPDFTARGLPKRTFDPGIPSLLGELIYPVPFNDADAIEAILKENADKIAGIILEPIPFSGGLELPLEGYLKRVRELCDQYNILLVFDEVVVFRLHEGGYHTLCGVKPDLIAFGKIIGGGFPIGAFGGREEIMRIYNPAVNPHPVGHSGTFSGNVAIMAAGYAALENFKQPDIDRINGLGDKLRAGWSKIMADAGVVGCSIGFGSIAAVGFLDGGSDNIRDFMLKYKDSIPCSSLYQIALLNHGVYIANRGAIALSTAITDEVVDEVLVRAAEALEDILPFVREEQAKYLK